MRNAEQYVLKMKSKEHAGRLADDAERLRWSYGKIPVPRVIGYGEKDGMEYFVMAYIEGSTAEDYEPGAGQKSMGRLLGEGLRTIHNVPAEDCPFRDFTPDRLIEMVHRNVLERRKEAEDAVRIAFPDSTV